MEPNLTRADLDQIGRYAIGYGSPEVRPACEIELALHGIRILWLREIREAEEQGRIDDAVDRASDAYMFREASDMLQRFANELDRVNVRLRLERRMRSPRD